MTFLEKDLESIIYETLNIDGGVDLLKNRGLGIISGAPITKVFRQLNIGNYGTSDLVTVGRTANDKYAYPELHIRVFELKQKTVNLGTLMQAYRYCKGIKRYLDKRGFDNEYTFHICLIGSEIDTHSDWVYMFDFELIDIDVYQYSYELDGLKFKRIDLADYSLSNEGFKL